MWWRHDARRTARHGLRLALIALLLPGAALATDGVALLELTINGRATHGVEPFVLRDGVAHARPAAWRALGVRLDAPAGADEPLSMAELPGARATLDLGRQTLALDIAPDPDALTIVERAGDDALPDARSTGAILNYDLGVQRAAGRHVSAGLLDARVSGPWGVLDHAVLASDAPGRPRVQRLATTLTQTDAAQLRRWRVGDLVGGGLPWTRPVRLLGVQLASDFALRPGLVTAPTPVLAGSAAVPSTLDVLVDGVRQLSQDIEPGAFEVRRLPVVSGLAEVTLVTRDALGRETLQRLPFYASSRQLAPGLSSYALEIGRVRRDFGVTADRYDALAASGTLRHGLTPALTFEAHAQAGDGSALAGGGGVLKLGEFGVASGALAASGGDGPGGRLASIGFERQTRRVGAQVTLLRATAGYRDLATAQGDAPLRASLQLGLGVEFGRYGRVALAAFDVQRGMRADGAAAERTRFVSATHSVALPGGVQATLSAFREFGAARGHGVAFALSLPFGSGGVVAASVTRDRAGRRAALSAGQSAFAPGDIGWRVEREQGLSAAVETRQRLQAELLAPLARATVEVEHAAGRRASRVGVQGALIVLGGRVHASRPVQDSVAVVDVDGLAGVAVFHENRPVGRTDAAGRLVVPGLLAYQRNRIAIEPLDLPLDAEPGVLTRELRPPERSGVLVRFAVPRSRSALVELRDRDGRPLPLGARVRVDGSLAPPATVGHAGLAYLRGLADRQQLRVAWGAREGCSVQVDAADLDVRTGRIGPLTCE